MDKIEQEIERIEKGDAWEETDQIVQAEVHKPLDKVIPVRLSGDKWEALRQEANELGIGPTTMARMWILERLRRAKPHTSWRDDVITTARVAETPGTYRPRRFFTPDELAKKIGISGKQVRAILREEYRGCNAGKYGRWHVPEAVAGWIETGRTGMKPTWNG